MASPLCAGRSCYQQASNGTHQAGHVKINRLPRLTARHGAGRRSDKIPARVSRRAMRQAPPSQPASRSGTTAPGPPKSSSGFSHTGSAPFSFPSFPNYTQETAARAEAASSRRNAVFRPTCLELRTAPDDSWEPRWELGTAVEVVGEAAEQALICCHHFPTRNSCRRARWTRCTYDNVTVTVACQYPAPVVSPDLSYTSV